MRRTFRSLPTAVILAAAVAACSRSDAAPADSDLQRDLEQVSETGLELAPRGSGTEVISAAELGRTPPAPPTPGPRGPRPAPRPTAPVEADMEPAAAPTAPVPSPAAAATAAPTPDTLGAPARRPAPVKPTRKGPYKTMEEVIRDAPFPIKP
jgi:hypothetical protein